MDFKGFLEHNYVMLFELFGILVILYISAHLSQKTKLYTRITIVLLIFVMIVHIVEASIRDLPYSMMARFFLTATKYSLYPIILMLMIYVVSPFKKKLKLKVKLLFWSLEIISVPLFFTSQWSKLICYFTEDENYISTYNGGVLKYWPYIIFAVYMICFIIFNFIMMRKYSNSNKAIILYICGGSLAGIILYLIFDAYDDYTPIFTAALVLYYLVLYIHLASKDQLTGLMSRQTYNQDLETREKSFVGVISVDMNELKYLNDTFGHDKGDEALICISKVLQDYSGSNATQYRVGGDEFVILYTKANEESLHANVMMMKEMLDKTEYSCAFGYALKKEGESIHDALKEADKLMYEDKMLMKIEKEKKGEVLHLRD